MLAHWPFANPIREIFMMGLLSFSHVLCANWCVFLCFKLVTKGANYDHHHRMRHLTSNSDLDDFIY